MITKLNKQPHRRFNPLSGEWFLLSPQRTDRPWDGEHHPASLETLPEYESGCYLCPGNQRAGGAVNDRYKGTYVFTNDFPALTTGNQEDQLNEADLFKASSVNGTSRVICFSERHDLTLAEMSLEEIKQVIQLWVDQTADLSSQYQWVQVFENKGSIMGCSNPHPHGQIWASSFIPELPAKEETQQLKYLEQHSKVLLLEYLKLELQKKDRLVVENDEWACLVPYWAVWPFEVMVLPKAHIRNLKELNVKQKEDLADLLKQLLVKYDNIFKTSFPYSMGWHEAPNNGQPSDHWQLHAHYFPPLLRSATVKKFMVGYEMLGNAQRDITPEIAAEIIRKQSTNHYKNLI